MSAANYQYQLRRVYAIYDEHDTCLYVGMTHERHPVHRWLDHVRKSPVWLHRAVRFEVITTEEDEKQATLRLRPEFTCAEVGISWRQEEARQRRSSPAIMTSTHEQGTNTMGTAEETPNAGYDQGFTDALRAIIAAADEHGDHTAIAAARELAANPPAWSLAE